MQTQNEISSADIVRAIYIALDKKGKAPTDTLHQSISREYVGVKNIQTGSWVTTGDHLLNLVNCLPDELQVNPLYCGPDSDVCRSVTAPLPEGYVARVGYVQVRHMPENLTTTEKVFVKKSGEEYGVYCKEFHPPFGDKAPKGTTLTDEKWMEEYNCITFKINKESGALVGWIPGRDMYSSPCGDLGEEYVVLGKPLKKKEPVVSTPEETGSFKEFQEFLRWKAMQKGGRK